MVQFGKMTSALKRIGTHDGKFHCDEVLACFLLRKLPEYEQSEIIRTRDKTILDTCHAVVDVGAVYDPENNKFDHHQREFKSTMNSLNPAKPWTIKLSSAGLIYHHFGEKILSAIVGPSYGEEVISKLYDYVYENFIQEIDAIDNGIEMWEGQPRYVIHTGISRRVSNLNPPWNNKESCDSMKIFHAAMDFVGRELIDKVEYFIKSYWPARKLVAEALSNRLNVHSSGAIIELETPCPWKEHLSELEKEEDLEGAIKFVIFSDSSWRVQVVPSTPTGFDARLFLPKKWWGLRDEELVATSGIDGSVFVHATGFIGGNKTREGAIQMASIALSEEKV